jgi:hypothetical protein
MALPLAARAAKTGGAGVDSHGSAVRSTISVRPAYDAARPGTSWWLALAHEPAAKREGGEQDQHERGKESAEKAAGDADRRDAHRPAGDWRPGDGPRGEGGPPEEVRRRFEEVRARVEQARQRIEQFRREGKHEEAEQLERNLREEMQRRIEEHRAPFRRPSPGDLPPGGEAAEPLRKARHLMAAAEHLRAAGLADKADQVQRMAEELKARIPESARPGPPPGDALEEVRRLREEVEHLRRHIQEMRERQERAAERD